MFGQKVSLLHECDKKAKIKSYSFLNLTVRFRSSQPENLEKNSQHWFFKFEVLYVLYVEQLG
jgi:hypothetical protein